MALTDPPDRLEPQPEAPPFAEVLFPVALDRCFTYAIPSELAGAVAPGQRVRAKLRGRATMGLVLSLVPTPPDGLDPQSLQPLLELLDPHPVLPSHMISLLRWAADYYMVPIGTMFQAALPLNHDPAKEPADVVYCHSPQDRLEDPLLTLLRTEGKVRLQRLLATFKGLRRQDLVLLAQQGAVELQPVHAILGKRRQRMIVRFEGPPPEGVLKGRGAPKQGVILELLKAQGGTMALTELEAAISTPQAALKALMQRGIVVMEEVEPPGMGDNGEVVATEHQGRAVERIVEALGQGDFKPFLLHGVTSSGKTEVYLRALEACRSMGRRALVMVPEISLTPQLTARIRGRLGEGMALIHSARTPLERRIALWRLRTGRAWLAAGARSAVFAPLSSLGLIIVDEEHDSSFKQEESPRYHSRDLALVLGQMSKAVVVLGSATPSLESLNNVERGRYELLSLPQRVERQAMPEVEVVDMRIKENKGGRVPVLSPVLLDSLKETLAEGEQAILFLNRRGFASLVLCPVCGFAHRCDQCTVSLTYHQETEELVCHYCGQKKPVISACESCGAELVRMGIGTERVVETLTDQLPEARVGRMDRDVAAAHGLQDVLSRFGSGKLDILVGTQMVTKGHDFPMVTLVGVILADLGLHIPDFRASERTFQLLTQVAGRAGRRDRPGRVIIQTFFPQHRSVVCATHHDTHTFASEEDRLRRHLGFPPHGYMVLLRFEGEKEDLVERVAKEFGALAARSSHAIARGSAVLGPVRASIYKIRGRARWQLLLKAPTRAAVRAILSRLMDGEELPPRRRGVRIIIDVDPLSML